MFSFGLFPPGMEHLAVDEDFDEYEASRMDTRMRDRERWLKQFAQSLSAKSRKFSKADVGKYVIARDSDKRPDLVPVLYLVDRRKCQEYWWSCDAKIAFVIDTETRADELASHYRGTNLRVLPITEEMTNG